MGNRSSNPSDSSCEALPPLSDSDRAVLKCKIQQTIANSDLSDEEKCAIWRLLTDVNVKNAIRVNNKKDGEGQFAYFNRTINENSKGQRAGIKTVSQLLKTLALLSQWRQFNNTDKTVRSLTVFAGYVDWIAMVVDAYSYTRGQNSCTELNEA